jgi:hypothetical protein
MPPLPPLPWRLIRISLILIFIGLLPRILPLIHLEPPSPARVLELLFVPPHIRQWLVDYVGYQGVLFVGVALLVLATILVVHKLLQARDTDKPISTSRVLLDEAVAIHGGEVDQDVEQAVHTFYSSEEDRRLGRDGLRDVSPKVFQWLYQAAPNGRTALCLSGGGIRSASFALGILQALAAHPRLPSATEDERAKKSLLAQFNYLSTVSGGGYIGGWLSAWLYRAGYQNVWRDLVRIAGRDQDPGEQAAPLKWLRVHSNFLTPKLGLSGDTLAGVAIVLRNLLLNWLVLLPVLCAVLIAMKLIALWVFNEWQQDWATKWWVPLVLWLVFLVSALTFTLGNRPSRTHGRERQATESDFIIWGLLPSGVAAVAFTLLLAVSIVHKEGYQQQLVAKYPTLDLSFSLMQPSRYGFIAAAFLGATIYALGYAISWISSWPGAVRRLWHRVRPPTENGEAKLVESITGNFWRWTISGAVYGALVMAITYLFLSSSETIERLIFLDVLGGTTTGVAVPRRLLALLYLGVPLMLLAQLLAEMIFVGLTSEEVYSDEDREWLGRAAGLGLLAGTAWLLVVHLAYISTDITIRAGSYFSQHPEQLLALIAALYIIGAIAAAVARSGRTPAQRDPQADAKTKTANTTLSIIAVVLLVVLIVGLSALIDSLILGQSIADCTRENMKCKGAWNDFWLALAVAVFVGWISSKNINVNRFSLHALYRNRLIRMFLGASNQEKRKANPFTDFDQGDNLPMWKLWPPAKGPWQPFHIVNIALNVSSSTQHLEWQERKAAPFTVSPLHSGSAVTGFRAGNVYGDGISLGTAMAISGAAASPNQGYISSAPLAFLMALFNVRLGWWLGNPGRSGKSTHKYDGPKNALVPFFSELLGMTSDTNKYVYLSDGGHFENLALYEMVRRRCRFIIVSDAGCDPDFEFEDLGNAVRKIGIDLGVPIHFYGLDKLRARHTPDRLDALLAGHPAPPGDDAGSAPYHAIGIIDYPAADGSGAKEGIILYIKPCYHGTERSAGIRSYALANVAFPHEPTGDQFFGESQMESYRALGFEITDSLLQQGLKDVREPEQTLQAVLTALADRARGGGRTSVPEQASV